MSVYCILIIIYWDLKSFIFVGKVIYSEDLCVWKSTISFLKSFSGSSTSNLKSCLLCFPQILYNIILLLFYCVVSLPVVKWVNLRSKEILTHYGLKLGHESDHKFMEVNFSYPKLIDVDWLAGVCVNSFFLISNDIHISHICVLNDSDPGSNNTSTTGSQWNFLVWHPFYWWLGESP